MANAAENNAGRHPVDVSHPTLAQPAAGGAAGGRHLEAIPRHAANSMAMEGEPVDEAWIRERLARFIESRSPSQPAPDPE